MLNICKKTFNLFLERDIKYCHWKSNEHLMEGLTGDTDLDVLVDRDSYNNTVSALMELGYKKGSTISYLDYPSIEDYIGFDYETGKIVHLHLHFELMIGKKFVKGIHLPWENLIYNTLKKDQDTALFIIDPNIEIILLFVRNYFKRNLVHKLKRKGLSKNDKIEFNWLKSRVTSDSLKEFSFQLDLGNLGERIYDYIEKPGSKNLKKIYKSVKKSVAKQVFFNNFRENYKYFTKKLKAASNYIKHKKLNKPVVYRRGLAEGGVTIAFLGVDGAGKSTLIKEINSWLSWKLDTHNIYFGSGDGSSSLIRKPLKAVAKLRVKKRKDPLNVTEEESKKSQKKLKWAKAIWAVTLASEKKSKINEMLKARSRSLIILTDRYPQTQIEGFNDGPLLGSWKESKSPLKRRMYNYEREIYNLSNIYQPDIFFKLSIPEELSASRKNDTPLYMIRKKIKAVKTITFDKSVEIVIDSSGSVDETSLKLKREIWNYLSGR